MKIWVVDQYTMPPSRPGITRYFYLAKELIQLGCEVTIISSNFCRVKGEYFSCDNHKDVPFEWIASPSYSSNSIKKLWSMMVFSVRALIKKFNVKERPDIILAPSPSPFSAFAAYLLAKRYKAKFVLEIRDLWPETLIKLGKLPSWHPLVLLFGSIQKVLVRNASAIVSQIPGAQDYLNSQNFSKKVFLLPNFVDLRKISKSDLPKHDNFTFMYAGSFNFGNDVSVIVKAANFLKDEKINIILVGDGPAKEDLVKYANENKLTNIFFRDAVSRADIYATLVHADAFVCAVRRSSLYEWGTSLTKLPDYMAMGRPIIYAHESSYTAELEKSGIIIAPPEDPQALAAAMRNLSQMSSNARLALGERAFQAVDSQHNLVKVADKLAGILNSVHQEEAVA